MIGLLLRVKYQQYGFQYAVSTNLNLILFPISFQPYVGEAQKFFHCKTDAAKKDRIAAKFRDFKMAERADVLWEFCDDFIGKCRDVFREIAVDDNQLWI